MTKAYCPTHGWRTYGQGFGDHPNGCWECGSEPIEPPANTPEDAPNV